MTESVHPAGVTDYLLEPLFLAEEAALPQAVEKRRRLQAGQRLLENLSDLVIDGGDSGRQMQQRMSALGTRQMKIMRRGR